MTLRSISASTLIFACVVSATELAPAAQITFVITGVIDFVTDPYGVLSPSVVNGSPFTAVAVYDTDTPDVEPLPTQGLFAFSPGKSSLTIDLNGARFASSELGMGSSIVKNDTLIDIGSDREPPPPGDALSLTWFSLVGPVSDFLISANISLYDHSAQAFSSDELPTSLDIAAFDSLFFQIFAYQSDTLPDPKAFILRLTPQSITVVPEPSSSALFAIGAFALISFVVRRRLASN